MTLYITVHNTPKISHVWRGKLLWTFSFLWVYFDTRFWTHRLRARLQIIRSISAEGSDFIIKIPLSCSIKTLGCNHRWQSVNIKQMLSSLQNVDGFLCRATICLDKDNSWTFIRHSEMVKFRNGGQFLEESFKTLAQSQKATGLSASLMSWGMLWPFLEERLTDSATSSRVSAVECLHFIFQSPKCQAGLNFVCPASIKENSML